MCKGNTYSKNRIRFDEHAIVIFMSDLITISLSHVTTVYICLYIESALAESRCARLKIPIYIHEYDLWNVFMTRLKRVFCYITNNNKLSYASQIKT